MKIEWNNASKTTQNLPHNKLSGNISHKNNYH